MQINGVIIDNIHYMNFIMFIIRTLRYGTVTYPLMDSSKSYINREPSTLVGRSVVRLDRDWIFDWQVSLAYATTFLCILLLQYILKLILCSDLSFRGLQLGPHHFFFLICPAEIGVRLIQLCVLYAVKYNIHFFSLCGSSERQNLRDDKFFFFLLINTWSGLLTGIRWSACISKSKRILCDSFFRTDSDLCIYHFIEWSYNNHLNNSLMITFPTQSCTLFVLVWCIRLLCD